MLIREKYLSKIRGFYEETSLIKIVYGMRRSGKSVILNQIMDEIKANGVKENNIIYINFESLKYDFIKDAKDLYEYIEKLTENDDKYIVMFYKTQDYSGDLIKETEEGEVFFTSLESLKYMNLSPNFDKYLPLFLTDTHSEIFCSWNPKMKEIADGEPDWDFQYK